jgi:indolepyruvate ferredoxin oxidoreductase
MSLKSVTLDDKYRFDESRVYLNGTQAIIRLALEQAKFDKERNFKTRGFVTGYRGSPLGAIDQAMDQARDKINEAGVVFRPGVNEDLAATAVLGTQQINLIEPSDYDGVFSLWYGKGPGVDRSGDALKHGNLSGTAPRGGVLLLLGDDHTCKSSTTSHQSEFAMVDAMIPVLNPSGVGEIISFGLYGIALSRFSGCWTAMKLVAETMDSSASIAANREPPNFIEPRLDTPEGGLHIRWPDTAQEQERRLHRHKLTAVHAFARANPIDRIEWINPNKRLGIVTTGKSYLDVRQALDILGIDEQRATELGLSIYKVGLVWPMEPEAIRNFGEGFQRLLIIEEKRPLLEGQIKDALYDLPSATRPEIYGKRGPDGEIWLPSHDDLSPARIALAIGRSLIDQIDDATLKDQIITLERLENEKALIKPASVQRTMYFCSGCPHSTSTRIPEGSRGMAGIGCHYMSLMMDRSTHFYTHMGAEGANWIGQSPFVKTPHIFQNIGDGTYFHSGLLAIRANVSAKTNITYKILFNDAVAMTGGQKHDGPLSPDRIAWQVHAEGVERIAVVADDPSRHESIQFPPGTTIHHRDEMDAVQRELREISGTTVIVYDQTCASEKRRRQKRGTMPEATTRAFIHEEVCEGCGDCSLKSNCVSITPLDTEFGIKRRINQSSCNKDLSCVKGFCPSFVTIEGGILRKPAISDLSNLLEQPLPDPVGPDLNRPWNIFVAGVGGNGVVTIGAVLAMAAHLEGKGCSTLDMIGMAQRGGAVTSHVRIAQEQSELTAVRIPAQSTDLLLASDIVTALGIESKGVIGSDKTRIILNTEETITGNFVRDRKARFRVNALTKELTHWIGRERIEALDASRISTVLLGDSIGANMFMVGYALQKGLIPLSVEAIERSIELNGASIRLNMMALRLGRLMAIDTKAIEAQMMLAVDPAVLDHRRLSQSIDEKIDRRADFLKAYQSEIYRRRYLATVEMVIETEKRVIGKEGRLTEAVALNLFHLMAIKDEYEIARLYSAKSFKAQLNETFSNYRKIRIHLAPPLLSKRNKANPEPLKFAFGSWIIGLFPLLSSLRFLRGSFIDPFGWTEERKRERQWRDDYEHLVNHVIKHVKAKNFEKAVELLSVPQEIKGFGHVREKAMTEAEAALRQLTREFDALAADKTSASGVDAQHRSNVA